MIDFEELVDQVVDARWTDLNDRPKLETAMKFLCERMPENVFDNLPRIVVFAPTPWTSSWKEHGKVMPIPSNAVGAMIYFSPYLEEQPQEYSDFTVAHEFAHAFLRHYESMMSPEPLNYLDGPNEIAADQLVQQWGYVLPDYRSRR